VWGFGKISGGELVLKKAFSDLFGIACTKGAFVVDHLENPRGSLQWNLNFARMTHHWEVDVFA
jgi:hypothetical protein